jgi:hypothetical protein
MSGPAHAAPRPAKTHKERSDTVEQRPETHVPAEHPVEQTLMMPPITDHGTPIVDGRNGLTGLIPPHTTDVIRTNVEDLQAGKVREWATGSFPVRGVAVGVPSPDQVFLNAAAPADFTKWLEGWVQDTAPGIQSKAETYGSNSLAAMGRRAAQLQGRVVSEVEALELGCWLYSSGKMERVTDAVLRGELPGRDTWHDIACYALMVLSIREHGRWP